MHEPITSYLHEAYGNCSSGVIVLHVVGTFTKIRTLCSIFHDGQLNYDIGTHCASKRFKQSEVSRIET